MDAKHFVTMISDKKLFDLKRLEYKYTPEMVVEFIGLLKSSMYSTLTLRDFSGHKLVYLPHLSGVRASAVKLLLTPKGGNAVLGLKAMGDEIHSTLAIESIDSSRDSIRRILNGYAPASDNENSIYGLKKGLDFIADLSHKITEANLHQLYQVAVGDFLDKDNQLLFGEFYRHDEVFIVGSKHTHGGLPHDKLPQYMAEMVEFVNTKDEMNDLLKAATIHFYLAYLHPYFDGNGRTARLLHHWYLVQAGYPAALFVPLSRYVNESLRDYYKVFTQVEQNALVSGLVDFTPFLIYFNQHVYNKLGDGSGNIQSPEAFQKLLAQGRITEKERDLWSFVLTAYGLDEFSTKQLERDFANAAYATIRSFVHKFEGLGLLSSQRYGNRVKYRLGNE